jgi:hypothetical protein
MFVRLLERIGRSLRRASIPYMVIGGQAVLIYGEPRMTRDIDITLGVGPADWERVAALFAGLNLKGLVDDPATFVGRTMVLPALEEKTGIRVDFIFSTSAYEAGALCRAKGVKIGRFAVRFASVEDVIIHKVIAGRPRDIEDVRILLLKNPEMDTDIVRRWLREFDIDLGAAYEQEFDRVLFALKRFSSRD